MLGGGLCRPGGRGNFSGCSALLEMYFNSKSAKNGNTLTAQYTYKLYNIHTYRQNLASAIHGCSLFTDAHLYLREKVLLKDELCNSCI